MPSDAAHAAALLAKVADRLAPLAAQTRLLDAISWPRTVEERFLAAKGEALPQPEYAIDREAAGARIRALAGLERELEGDGPVAAWLRALVRSFIDGNRLLLAVGTRDFHLLSREVYGGARTGLLGGQVTNLELAEHLLERLQGVAADEALDADPAPLSAEQFAAALRELVEARKPAMPLEVVLDDRCAAKVIAGRTRVRVRAGATFMPWEVAELWRHEVETHALTAQNGSAQPHAPFLKFGGPRTTRSQEGLAVFAELYEGGLTVARIDRLAVRVRLVDAAERGADFLELYRLLLGRGATPHEAFLDAQRICRGGLVGGGGPFTKDACYLAGLLEVYAALSVLVRGGRREEAELLVAGRLNLDDLPALAELRRLGLLERPRYLPRWLRSWRELLPYFAFASFFTEVRLAPVERHYRALLEPQRSS